MRNHLLKFGRVAIINSLLLAGITYVFAESSPHQQMQMGQQLKIGKTGTIIFSEPHKLGHVLLPAGKYQMSHRIAGEDHLVQFKRIDGRGFGEIKCKVEPLNQKVSDTAITVANEGGTLRIIRIEIAGENVAHLI